MNFRSVRQILKEYFPKEYARRYPEKTRGTGLAKDFIDGVRKGLEKTELQAPETV